MLFLPLALPSPAENLALDEALLEACDKGGPEVLRTWRPAQKSVVVGYTQRVEQEVNVAACQQDGVPVLRRISGGGTVLHDAGSICYALILRNDSADYPTVGCANRRITAHHRDAIARLVGSRHSGDIEVHGDTDLAMGKRKFSGNAQRRKVHAFVFHGTFLLNIDYDAMERYLLSPSRQPEYRSGRDHRSFMAPLPVDEEKLVLALQLQWEASEIFPRDNVPLARVETLLASQYSRDSWNYK